MAIITSSAKKPQNRQYTAHKWSVTASSSSGLGRKFPFRSALTRLGLYESAFWNSPSTAAFFVAVFTRLSC